MSSVFKSLESGDAIFTRKIEFPARARTEIVRDDTLDLRTKRLSSNCKDLAVKRTIGERRFVLDVDFMPFSMSTSSIESVWYRVVLVVDANDCVSW